MTTTTDAALFERWSRNADGDAFAEIVRRHGRMVQGTCRRVVRDAATAEDLAQEVFWRLSRAAEAPGRSLGAWLHTVALNVARSARRRSRTQQPIEDFGDERDAPEQVVSWREIERHVDDAIAELPESLRAVVIGHYLDGVSHEDLSRQLGLGRRAVGYRVQRGVAAVRGALKRRGVDVSLVTLVACLTTLPARAGVTSTTLLSSMGKVALAGPVGTGAVVAVAGAASHLMLSAFALVAILVLGIVVWPEPASATPPAGGGAAQALAGNTDPAGNADPAEDSESGRRELAAESRDAAPAAASNAQLLGTVRDEDGQPIVGARVLAYSVEQPSMMSAWRPVVKSVRSVETDAEGKFSVARLNPDQNGRVSVSAAGYVNRHQWFGEGKEPGPLDFVLERGRTLEGRVLDREGRPVTRALVSIWHIWKEQAYGDAVGGVLTESDGSFRIGIDTEAVACTLRVTSSSPRDAIFGEVPCDQFALLQTREPATLRGVVHGYPTSDAPELRVVASGAVMDPPIPVFRSGFQPREQFSTSVDADGTYELTGLPIGYVFDARLERVSDGQTIHRPDGASFFDVLELEPGQVRQQDFEYRAPIQVRGTVRTADGRPVADARIRVSLEGSRVIDGYSSTDADGRFESTLNAGAGRYTFDVLPRNGRPHDPGRLRVERALRPGEIVDLEFTAPNPVEVPLLIVDEQGDPVKSVQLAVVIPGEGGRTRHSASRRLDADGRTVVRIHQQIERFTIEVGAFPVGPTRFLTFDRIPQGEQRVTLATGLPATGLVLKSDGTPWTAQMFRLIGRYADETQDECHVSSDDEGRFRTPPRFRRGHVDFLLLVPGQPALERSAAAGDAKEFELGTLQAR